MSLRVQVVNGLAAPLTRYIGRLKGWASVEDVRKVNDQLCSLVRTAGSRPVVLCYLIKDVLPMMVVAAINPSGAFARLRWVCDDTIGGLVSARVIASLGGGVFILPWGSAGRRIRAIGALRQLETPWGITVDGHGPYGEVNPALVRLLSTLDALVLPVAATAHPETYVLLRAKLAIPLPWSVVRLRVGAIVDVREHGVGTGRVLSERLSSISLRGT